mgnify:CR=1 FL=1
MFAMLTSERFFMNSKQQTRTDAAVHGVIAIFSAVAMLAGIEGSRFLAEGEKYNCQDGLAAIFCANPIDETNVTSTADFSVEL